MSYGDDLNFDFGPYTYKRWINNDNEGILDKLYIFNNASECCNQLYDEEGLPLYEDKVYFPYVEYEVEEADICCELQFFININHDVGGLRLVNLFFESEEAGLGAAGKNVNGLLVPIKNEDRHSFGLYAANIYEFNEYVSLYKQIANFLVDYEDDIIERPSYFVKIFLEKFGSNSLLEIDQMYNLNE